MSMGTLYRRGSGVRVGIGCGILLEFSNDYTLGSLLHFLSSVVCSNY